MENITNDQLYAFARMLKENKPLPSVSVNKINHWVELINVMLGGKFDEVFKKLKEESKDIQFKTVPETLTIAEFDRKMNTGEIKGSRIINSKLNSDGKLEILYRKKVEAGDKK